MELRDYLRILRRRWKLVAATFLLAIAAASLVTARMTPTYTSSASLFVSTTPTNAADAYSGGLFSQQRVASYADLATGQKLASQVIHRLGLRMTPTQLSSEISAQVAPNSVILTVSVTDPNPQNAQRLTSAVSDQLTALVADLETPPGKSTPVLKATVVNPATLPHAPSAPQPVRNIGLAAVLGLLLGFGIAVLREVLDTTVKSNTEAEEAAGASVVAGIGYDPNAAKNPLITGLESHAPRAEAFRVLRTNLQFLDVDAASKAYVITSSVPGEGKSTTAVNVALSLAQSGRRILLIDGDLRRPQVANMLGLEPAVGLTRVLVGSIDFEDALQEYRTTGLSVLTSGTIPPNPAELLQSHSMADLMDQARKRFDIVILDSPPLLPVTDAALLATNADGALLVVRHGSTTREQLRGATQRLHAVEARALGLVLNMVPSSGTGYGYGYGYGYAPTSTTGASV